MRHSIRKLHGCLGESLQEKGQWVYLELFYGYMNIKHTHPLSSIIHKGLCNE